MTHEEAVILLQRFIETLNTLQKSEFYNPDTGRYHPVRTEIQKLLVRLDYGAQARERLKEKDLSATAGWLPANPSAIDDMEPAEIAYRTVSNIAGERWVDGAVVRAFASGSLAKALERIKASIHNFEIQEPVR